MTDRTKRWTVPDDKSLPTRQPTRPLREQVRPPLPKDYDKK